MTLEALSFPITVKRFLSEANFHLRRGDIILSRSLTFSSWMIRFATGSTFSHAAIVFLTPKKEDGFNNTFILESTSAGVGLANLKDYIQGRKANTEIVVLRFEHPQATEDYFKTVRGLMLDHIKSGYDYGRIVRLALSLLFGLRLIGSRITSGKNTSMRTAVDGSRKKILKNWVPPEFICSGFIQYGFVEAARRLGLDVETVVMRDGLSSRDRDGILAVTPEDLANSKKLRWHYVIRRGQVYAINSYAEAKAKLG